MEIDIAHPTVLTLNLPFGTILALDSRVCKFWDASVVSNRFDKLIQLRPCVFLGCFADCRLIDQVKDALFADLPQNPRFIGDLALFVQNTINKVLANANNNHYNTNNILRSMEFVLIGRCDLDSRCYVFNITKWVPNNTWMCFAKRGVGRVATATARIIGFVTRFMENNVLGENVTEEEAIDYALRCMIYAGSNSIVSGGKIQVVLVKNGSSIVHAWEQDDPTKCWNPYFYQGNRMSEGF